MPLTHEQAIQLIESFAFRGGGGALEKVGEKEKKKPPSAHSDRYRCRSRYRSVVSK